MLRWARKARATGERRDAYAKHSDFCAIFFRQLDRLYSLSLILTGDELRAEECLLAALDSCVNGSLVFKESAVAWSRRTVIKCAIRFMWTSPSNSRRSDLVAKGCDSSSDQDTSLKYLQGLPLFDRFVYVMSVLERYSDRECALLLGCACADILPARIRAFRQMSTPIENSYPPLSSGGQAYVFDPDWLEC